MLVTLSWSRTHWKRWQPSDGDGGAAGETVGVGEGFIDDEDHGNDDTRQWRSTRGQANRQRDAIVSTLRELEQNRRRVDGSTVGGDVARRDWPSSSFSPNFSNQR